MSQIHIMLRKRSQNIKLALDKELTLRRNKEMDSSKIQDLTHYQMQLPPNLRDKNGDLDLRQERQQSTGTQRFSQVQVHTQFQLRLLRDQNMVWVLNFRKEARHKVQQEIQDQANMIFRIKTISRC